MSEMKKMIQVGTGGFGVYWLESIIPRVSDFARLVAAVDVKEEALKNAVVLAGLPKEKCYTDLRRALKENKADFVNVVVPPNSMRRLSMKHWKQVWILSVKSLWEKIWKQVYVFGIR